MDKQGLKKVYCKDCKYKGYESITYGFTHCKKFFTPESIKESFSGRYWVPSNDVSTDNFNSTGECKDYKRKWYLFWR